MDDGAALGSAAWALVGFAALGAMAFVPDGWWKAG